MDDIATEFQNQLQHDFEYVSVTSIETFPDLRKFGLKKSGLGSVPGGEKNVLVDMGGPPNMDDPTRHKIYFDLQEIINETFYRRGIQRQQALRLHGDDNCIELNDEASESNNQSNCLTIGAFAAGKLCAGINAEGTSMKPGGMSRNTLVASVISSLQEVFRAVPDFICTSKNG